MRNILVAGEQYDGAVSRATFELAAFGLDVAKRTGARVAVALAGNRAEEAAAEISVATGCDAVAVNIHDKRAAGGDRFKAALARLCGEMKTSLIIAAHNPAGLDFAPGLAVMLGASCVTGVDGVRAREGGTGFLRTAYNGKVRLEVFPDTDTTVVTVQPGVFAPSFENAGNPGEVTVKEYTGITERVQYEELKRADVGVSNLENADIIVAAGRGIGKEENLELVERFARCFGKSAVAGSRPMIDAGWMKHGRQVGLTGATVAPGLYVACGISGSSQHQAGMKDSKFIVAINSDPDAAIFKIADVRIVEDVLSFMKTFIEVSGAEKYTDN